MNQVNDTAGSGRSRDLRPCPLPRVANAGRWVAGRRGQRRCTARSWPSLRPSCSLLMSEGTPGTPDSVAVSPRLQTVPRTPIRQLPGAPRPALAVVFRARRPATGSTRPTVRRYLGAQRRGRAGLLPAKDVSAAFTGDSDHTAEESQRRQELQPDRVVERSPQGSVPPVVLRDRSLATGSSGHPSCSRPGRDWPWSWPVPPRSRGRSPQNSVAALRPCLAWARRSCGPNR